MPAAVFASLSCIFSAKENWIIVALISYKIESTTEGVLIDKDRKP